jgi:Acetyltransferase (GNAT) family
MGISGSFTRFTNYYSRHGLRATVGRAGLALKRAIFFGHMVVFYCDLAGQAPGPVNMPSSVRIDRLSREAEIPQEDLREITSFWNPKQARRNIKERFAKGASLWLIRSEDRVAGYGWTLQGRTIAEYYFPMGPKDVQLFDFYVFPKFRGRAMHWLLTAYIVQTLSAEGAMRAFADTGEWNQAQISSFKMTPFRRLGLARSFTLVGRRFVCWAEKETGEQGESAGRAKPGPDCGQRHK